MRLRALHITLFLYITLSAFANIKPIGISFVENYPKEVYKAGTQSWSIDQDENGIMYYGNNFGLLTFDSQNWRLYPVPNNSIVRSILAGDDGRIYTGCFDDFGYFSADEQGELNYTSLLEKVPEEYRNFGEVWKIMNYEDGIIFHSYNAVFFLSNDEVSVITFQNDLHFAFDLNGQYLVKQNNVGLLQLGSAGLELIPHSEFFGEIIVSAVLPYKDNQFLVCTREDGIFVLDDSGVKPFSTPLQDFFKSNEIFSAILFKDSHIILGTVQNGLVILDIQGNLVQHINRNRGLQNNTILSLFTDESDNLWLGLDNGIDYVLINSPLSYVAHERDIGASYVVSHKDQTLYMGTNQGIYSATWPLQASLESNADNFSFIEGSQGQVWNMQNKKNQLLVGHDKGSFLLDENKLEYLNHVSGGWIFIDVPGQENSLLEGTYTGLLKYRLEGEGDAAKWVLEKAVGGFYESCRRLEFDEQGYLWVGHGIKGIFRLRLNESMDSVTEIRLFDENSGLPSTYHLNLLSFEDRIIISSTEGIFSYNYEKNNFDSRPDLWELFSHFNVQNLMKDDAGNIWFFSSDELGVLKSNFDGSYNRTAKPFFPVHERTIAAFEDVHAIDRSNIFFSTEEGVIHFDPEFSRDYNAPFKVSIRKVEVLPDSLIYGGHQSSLMDDQERNAIRYRDNKLRFSYSALSYEFPANNIYSFMLEGFDESWSEWSSSTEKEYTNLADGAYAFRVRAKNIYGEISESEPYRFVILPPWYRTPIAYSIYVILIFFFVVLLVRAVLRQIEKEKLALNAQQEADLKEREKRYAEDAMKAEQEIIKLRNEKLEAENQRNLAEIDSKSKELASTAMQITYKNEMLTRIKQKLIRVSGKMLHEESKKQVNDLIKTLDKDMITQDEWERFEVHFDQVHEDFLKKLRTEFKELTPKDLRLCAYLRMNLSSKEIAPLLNISVRGVEISRYRLRKKMGLDRDENLTDFMMKL